MGVSRDFIESLYTHPNLLITDQMCMLWVCLQESFPMPSVSYVVRLVISLAPVLTTPAVFTPEVCPAPSRLCILITV